MSNSDQVFLSMALIVVIFAVVIWAALKLTEEKR